MAVGVAISLSGLNPIRALYWAAVINAVISVPIMVAVMLAASRPKIMGELVLPRRWQDLGLARYRGDGTGHHRNVRHHDLTAWEIRAASFSLIDSERQWFKSPVSQDETGTTLEAAFCNGGDQAPLGEVMVVEDARLDPRFTTNSFVTGEARIRFYAGAGLATWNIAIATLASISG